MMADASSPGTGIVLFSLSSIVTYLLSIVVLKEPISVLKILSLALSFGGVVMITFGDRENSKSTHTHHRTRAMEEVCANTDAQTRI